MPRAPPPSARSRPRSGVEPSGVARERRESAGAARAVDAAIRLGRCRQASGIDAAAARDADSVGVTVEPLERRIDRGELVARAIVEAEEQGSGRFLLRLVGIVGLDLRAEPTELVLGARDAGEDRAAFLQ